MDTKILELDVSVFIYINIDNKFLNINVSELLYYLKNMKVVIKPSKLKSKKYTAIFTDDKGKKVKTTHFGAKGMSDYTKHKDDKRKQRYLDRHKARENWNDYMSAGSLSRWILWNKPTIKASKEDYKSRFKLN